MITSQSTNMTVAEYCTGMERGEITVNKQYQRSDEVWPDVARSFLVESILLGFPIPKIYLHSITDLKSRKTKKEIVDGQQRSRAICDFFFDRFPLSRHLETEELRELTYSELPSEWQARFISASLSIDLFLAATPDEVVQVFRRMNSYTVPLNPEELRNAEYQGAFKWLVYEKCGTYSARLAALEIFSSKSLVRMADFKLVTEILHATENGITTTNAKVLNALYKKYDRTPPPDRMSKSIDFALDEIAAMEFIRGTNLAKPYMIYSLALALIDGVYPIPGLETFREVPDFKSLKVERRLLGLSAALDLGDEQALASPYNAFIQASRERTNVKAQRETRTQWFIAALSGSASS